MCGSSLRRLEGEPGQHPRGCHGFDGFECREVPLGLGRFGGAGRAERFGVGRDLGGVVRFDDDAAGFDPLPLGGVLSREPFCDWASWRSDAMKPVPPPSALAISRALAPAAWAWRPSECSPL